MSTDMNWIVNIAADSSTPRRSPYYFHCKKCADKKAAEVHGRVERVKRDD